MPAELPLPQALDPQGSLPCLKSFSKRNSRSGCGQGRDKAGVGRDHTPARLHVMLPSPPVLLNMVNGTRQNRNDRQEVREQAWKMVVVGDAVG